MVNNFQDGDVLIASELNKRFALLKSNTINVVDTTISKMGFVYDIRKTIGTNSVIQKNEFGVTTGEAPSFYWGTSTDEETDKIPFYNINPIYAQAVASYRLLTKNTDTWTSVGTGTPSAETDTNGIINIKTTTSQGNFTYTMDNGIPKTNLKQISFFGKNAGRDFRSGDISYLNIGDGTTFSTLIANEQSYAVSYGLNYYCVINYDSVTDYIHYTINWGTRQRQSDEIDFKMNDTTIGSIDVSTWTNIYLQLDVRESGYSDGNAFIYGLGTIHADVPLTSTLAIDLSQDGGAYAGNYSNGEYVESTANEIQAKLKYTIASTEVVHSHGWGVLVH